MAIINGGHDEEKEANIQYVKNQALWLSQTELLSE